MSYSKTDIENLLRIFRESDWDELYLQIGDLKLDVSRSDDEGTENRDVTVSLELADATSADPSKPEPDTASAPADMTEPVATRQSDIDGHVIRAPNLGTFWRQPKPGARAYVDVGQEIDEETTVCLIEVMKLFTPVKAAARGRIVEVLAENGQMVEADTPLFRLEATG